MVGYGAVMRGKYREPFKKLENQREQTKTVTNLQGRLDKVPLEVQQKCLSPLRTKQMGISSRQLACKLRVKGCLGREGGAEIKNKKGTECCPRSSG